MSVHRSVRLGAMRRPGGARTAGARAASARLALLSKPAARQGAAAAMVRRRVTVSCAWRPVSTRITVRAHLEGNRLSPPRRRYLRVLG